MSDSNGDLYGEREIPKKLHWTEKEFHTCERRYVIVAGWGYFVRSFVVLTHFLSVRRQITPAPYNIHIDLAIQTLYIS